MVTISFRDFRIGTLCVFAACMVVHTLAFSTPFWYKRKDMYGWLVYHGLWVLCDFYRTGSKDEKCMNIVNRHDNFEDGQLRTVQAFMIISLLCNIHAAAVFISWMVCGESRMSVTSSKIIGMIGFILCIVSGTLTLVCITWFGIYYSSYWHVLDWSYVLASIAGGIIFLGGIIGLIILQKWTLSRQPPKRERILLPSPPAGRLMPPLPTIEVQPTIPEPRLELPPVEPRSRLHNTSFDTASTATSIYDGDFTDDKRDLGSMYEGDMFEERLSAIYEEDIAEKKQLVDLEYSHNYASYTNHII